MHIRTLELSKGFGQRQLFENLSFSFHDNEHIGLIGPNGSGKSTLMKIIIGQEEADSGCVDGTNNLRIGYVPQEDCLNNEQTLEKCMLESLAKLNLQEHERTTKVRVTLGKVGFTDFSQKVGKLSGGWRKRLSIAYELAKEPDLLLLDEPTNHLDLQGVYWLEQFLQKTNTGFIIISHDRYILESVTDRIIEINRRYPEGYLSFPGCYSDFLEHREEWFAAQEKLENSLSSVVRREIDWLRRGPSARRTKAKGRIQSAHQKIDDLSEVRRRNRQESLSALNFSATNRKTNDLIVAEDLQKSLGGKLLFSNLSVTISPGSRIGIVGNNGSGKTTLIRTLVGELEPDEGRMKHAQQLKFAWFDQKREQLDRTQTLKRELAPNGDMIQIGERKVHVITWAKEFLFRTDQLDTPVGELSGGEQARVLMATLMRHSTDVLFFDEPTNDLDIESIEILEERMAEFPGAVILITHDRAMLDRLCDEVVGLHDGGVSKVYGELAQWQSAEEKRVREQSKQKKPKTPQTKKAPQGLSREEKKELNKIESLIEKAESKLEKLHKEANDPEILNDHKRSHEHFQKVGEAQEEVERLYARWEELEQKKAAQ